MKSLNILKDRELSARDVASKNEMETSGPRIGMTFPMLKNGLLPVKPCHT